jgi:hypothetical protein
MEDLTYKEIRTLTARGLKEHVRVSLIFAIIVSFMLFTCVYSRLLLCPDKMCSFAIFLMD